MSRRNSVSHGHLGGYAIGSPVVQRLDRRRRTDWPPADHAAARTVGRGTPRPEVDRRRAARRARRRTRQAQRRG